RRTSASRGRVMEYEVMEVTAKTSAAAIDGASGSVRRSASPDIVSDAAHKAATAPTRITTPTSGDRTAPTATARVPITRIVSGSAMLVAPMGRGTRPAR